MLRSHTSQCSDKERCKSWTETVCGAPSLPWSHKAVGLESTWVRLRPMQAEPALKRASDRRVA